MRKPPTAIDIRSELFSKATKLLIVSIIALLVFTLTVPPRAGAQTQEAAPSPVFEYDVSTIKLNKSNGESVGIHNTPDGYRATNVSSQMLIEWAFGVQNYQIVAGPDWFGSEHYDIEAKMDPAVSDALQKLNQDERKIKRQIMLRALLADRLKLTIHHETKELPIYSLVIAKNGPRLQETKTDSTAPIPRTGPSVTTKTGNGPIALVVVHCPGPDLGGVLVPYLGRTVVDKTGLTSVYDFTLQFTPDDTTSSPAPGSASAMTDPKAPSIFTAVQEQLGLKLESGKGPVDVIVIDHIERPSGN